MRKIIMLSIVLLTITFLSSCVNDKQYLHIQKVGMLVEGRVAEQPFAQEGKEALDKISKEFDVGVYFKESVETKYEMIQAIDELVKNGVNLIYGHSDSYGRVFVDMSYEYPDVHFVYLNGNYFNDTVTSIKYDAHAIGFFNGMIASRMSTTNVVGVLASYTWEAETKGFQAGANYQNPATQVQINFVNDWNKADLALQMYNEMKYSNVDVFYSLGDTFSFNIVEKAKKDNLYTLGDIIFDKGYQETTLATTTKNIDKIYLSIAEKFNDKELEGGIVIYGFQEGMVSLDHFNKAIPKRFQKVIKEDIETYAKEGTLPHEDSYP